MGNHQSSITTKSDVSMMSIGGTKPGVYSVEYWFDPKKMANEGKTLPIRVDLRRRKCFPYPIPEDQGTEGSCVTHAMSTAYICAQRRHNINVVNSDVPLISRLFEESRKKSKIKRPVSKGVTFSEAMKSLSDSAKWFRLGREVNNFKMCLSFGYPIVVGFAVSKIVKKWQDDARLLRSTEYVLPLSTSDQNEDDDNLHGYHCVLLVGYDDNFRGGVFIARNSWGPNWGHNGHFYFPYQLIGKDNVLLDAMVIDITMQK